MKSQEHARTRDFLERKLGRKTDLESEEEERFSHL